MRATALGLSALLAGAAGAGCTAMDPTFVVQPGAAVAAPAQPVAADAEIGHVSVNGAAERPAGSSPESVGGGFTVARGRECFVVTAYHVVREPVPEFEVFGRQASRAVGSLVLETGTEDVAVLRVDRGAALCDGVGFPSFAGVEAALAGTEVGTLLRRQPEGGDLEEIAVQLLTRKERELEIAPRPGQPPVSQGMSGSVLVVANRPVGLLLTVKNGVGTVRRLDRLGPVVTGFFFRVEQRDRLYTSVSTHLNAYLFQLQNVVGAFAKDAARAIDREDAFQTLQGSQASYETAWRPLWDQRENMPAELTRLWGPAQAAEYRALFDGQIVRIHETYVFNGLNEVRADMNAGRIERARRRDPSAFRQTTDAKAGAVSEAVDGAVPELRRRIDAFLKDLRAPTALR